MNLILEEIYNVLGIYQQHLDANKLAFHAQPKMEELHVVAIDFEGKPFILTSAAANSWKLMTESAQHDQVSLLPFSGFRSYLHQRNLIERHLKNGRKIEDILTHIAIPGFSEHHSGRAIDIHSADHAVLEEAFERTDAFAWLKTNASRFGFRLSYPRNNPLGIVYEPWHWFYTGE